MQTEQSAARRVVTITSQEESALALFRAQQGRQWRACLRQMWHAGPGHYWGTHTVPAVMDALYERTGGRPERLPRAPKAR